MNLEEFRAYQINRIKHLRCRSKQAYEDSQAKPWKGFSIICEPEGFVYDRRRDKKRRMKRLVWELRALTKEYKKRGVQR